MSGRILLVRMLDAQEKPVPSGRVLSPRLLALRAPLGEPKILEDKECPPREGPQAGDIVDATARAMNLGFQIIQGRQGL